MEKNNKLINKQQTKTYQKENQSLINDMRDTI